MRDLELLLRIQLRLARIETLLENDLIHWRVDDPANPALSVQLALIRIETQLRLSHQKCQPR